MIDYIDAFLRDNPSALLFTILGLGYLVGKTRVRGFELGSVSGVLFVGLLFGHFGHAVHASAQSMGFVLFIFSVGLQAGPSFFSVLRAEGVKHIALACVIGVTGFLLAVGFSELLDLAPGTAGGLLAGGMTSSPTLAAAQEAVRAGQVPLPEGYTADQVMTNVTTGYAITYVFGLVGLIMLLQLMPRILRVDLPAEAARLEAGRTEQLEDRASGVESLVVRAYRVTGDNYIGKSLREIYDAHPGQASVERIRRGGKLIDATLDTRIERDDEVCVVGRLEQQLERGKAVGPELSDRELLDIPLDSGRIIVMRSKTGARTVAPADVVRRHGCFLKRIQRLGVDVPVAATVTIRPGDVLHVTGTGLRLQSLGESLGAIERRTEQTDLVTLGLGIALGLLVGTFSVTIGGVSVGLGATGGLVTVGLVLGYLRVLRPTFGRMPAAARWIFMELGLLMFMAGIGLRAGSSIVATLAESGPSLLLAGIVVTSVPVLVGCFFGRKVLKLDAVMLMGAITGSMTSGASLSVVTDMAKSSLPALGYTGAYAFANILLTVAGSLILLF